MAADALARCQGSNTLKYCLCRTKWTLVVYVEGSKLPVPSPCRGMIKMEFMFHEINSVWTLNVQCWGISAKTSGKGDVFTPDDLVSGLCNPFIIYIPYIIAAIVVIRINSKRHTYQKMVWPCWCIGWFYTVIVSCPVSSVHFSCIVQYSLYHNIDISTMWHCKLVSSTPSQSIGLVFRCALFWWWVSLGAPDTISLIELYFMMIFIMIVVTLIGILGFL